MLAHTADPSFLEAPAQINNIKIITLYGFSRMGKARRTRQKNTVRIISDKSVFCSKCEDEHGIRIHLSNRHRFADNTHKPDEDFNDDDARPTPHLPTARRGSRNEKEARAARILSVVFFTILVVKFSLSRVCIYSYSVELRQIHSTCDDIIRAHIYKLRIAINDVHIV